MSRPVPAGKRDQLVAIQVLQTGSDDVGQPLDAWTEVGKWWCRARPVRGKDQVAADAVQRSSPVVFSGDYRSDVTAAMRVLWRGIPYHITAEPIDVDAGRHTLELLCSPRPAAVPGP